ncbi:GNAT family N-acetyltransferase [Salininema proteolyticum]|uniref:GNAT family N-acetyltransferase n=1 Tax=Salininema proteolyticum TaxID=1607685 RepID=A0ABV8U568_9ACTN
MTVRDAVVGDAPALVGLFDQLGHPATLDALEKRLRRNAIPEYRAWVFEGPGEVGVVGFAGGHLILPFEDDRPAAQLVALVVDERHRGLGAGSSLVAAFERWAEAEGAGRLSLTSRLSRERAHLFYEARGYERTGFRFGKRL